MKRPRFEVVIDRDPDNDTAVHLFVDGVEVPVSRDATDDIVFCVVDPGRSGADAEWTQSMRQIAKDYSPAVTAKIRELVDYYAEGR